MSKDHQTPSLIDRFIPRYDVRERHETSVRAPAAVVLDVARNFNMESIPLVRAIFRLRAKMMGTRVPGAAPQGLVAETTRLGWGVLYDEPERIFIAGSACQPWLADVVFTSIPASRFAAYAEPDRVKIVWTLEADEAGAGLTRFSSETRVIATDEQARKKFRRYWRVYGFGIVIIRWLMLPAVRRQAERRWREKSSGRR